MVEGRRGANTGFEPTTKRWLGENEGGTLVVV